MLRLSNVVNLKWNQVNLFSKLIVLETTKNGQPHSVPMTDNVLDMLKTLYMDKESCYVFGYGKGGKPFNSSWVNKSFRDACKEASAKLVRYLSQDEETSLINVLSAWLKHIVTNY